MKKALPVCPKCGEEVKLPKPAKARRSEPAPIASVPVPVPVKAKPIVALDDKIDDDDDLDDDLDDDVDLDVDLDDDLDDDEEEEKQVLIADASELGEDDDDILEVREHVDEGVEDRG